MRPLFYLMVATLMIVGNAAIASADTTVHGIVIRTADEAGLPQLRVCTSTQSRQWSNTGTNDTAVVFCPAPSPGGVRTVSFPEAQAAVALLEEQVLFAHDSFEMTEEAMVAIRTVSVFMAETPTATLILAGHADATGTAEYNMGLSQRRAEIARDFFLANGTSEAQIEVVWFGETQLVVETLRREPTNRRVDFILSE